MATFIAANAESKEAILLRITFLFAMRFRKLSSAGRQRYTPAVIGTWRVAKRSESYHI
jgi:hypothetical protein